MVKFENESLVMKITDLPYSPSTCIHLRCPCPLPKMESCLKLCDLTVHVQMGCISKGVLQFCLYFLVVIEKFDFLSRPPISTFFLSDLLENSDHSTLMVSTTTHTKY